MYKGFNLLFEKVHGINMSLDQNMKITIDGMKKYMSGFDLIESSERVINGHPAHQIIYLATHESMKMKFFSMFATRKGNVFTFSFNTLTDEFDSFRNTYEKMIGSFQFIH
jgi:hypothetical protein